LAPYWKNLGFWWISLAIVYTTASWADDVTFVDDVLMGPR